MSIKNNQKCKIKKIIKKIFTSMLENNINNREYNLNLDGNN